MSLVKFGWRRFRNLMSHDFFDMDYFFDNLRWVRNMLPDSFWTGKSSEPTLNIKERVHNFEIELAAPRFGRKDFEVTFEDGCLKIKAEKSTMTKQRMKITLEGNLVTTHLSQPYNCLKG